MHIRPITLALLGFLSSAIVSAQNAKMKTIEIPRFGLSFNFPKETVQKKLTDSTAQYFFEIFDTGGKNIGTGEFNIYPFATNVTDSNLLAQVRSQAENYKLGDSYQFVGTERKILKGIYQLIILKSLYRFNGKDFSIGREDYLYLGCKGITHIMFTIPSYNCYLTENDRALLTHNYFLWYLKNVKDRNLQISYTMPVGVFGTSPHADKNGISFRTCIKDYLTEIDLFKLTAVKGGLDAVAKAWKAKTKKARDYNNRAYLPANLKNKFVAQSYNRKINSKEFLFHEYVFKSGDNYFAAIVKNTCSDMDGCGSPLFISEVEKILDSVVSIEQKKTSDDDWDFFDF